MYVPSESVYGTGGYETDPKEKDYFVLTVKETGEQ